MASKYLDAYGDVTLKQITPVITALFGLYNIRKDVEEGGFVIAQDAAKDSVSWGAYVDPLQALTSSLNLNLAADADPDDVCEYLYALSTHFGADNAEPIGALIEQINDDDHVELSALFLLARHFDDGHGLTSISIEGVWHSDQDRLGAFGAECEFLGLHYSHHLSSSSTIDVGNAINEALSVNDLGMAATALEKQVEQLLDGVADSFRASLLKKMLGQRLISRASGLPLISELDVRVQDSCIDSLPAPDDLFDRLTALPNKCFKGTFKQSVERLKRPYYVVSEVQFERVKALAGNSDVMLLDGTTQVTFGTADSGFALMPLRIPL